MDAQADIAQVVHMLAGDEPDDLADSVLGIMSGHAGKRARIHRFLSRQFRHVVQHCAFRIGKQRAGSLSSCSATLYPGLDPHSDKRASCQLTSGFYIDCPATCLPEKASCKSDSISEFLLSFRAPASGNGLAEAGRTRQGSPLRSDERATTARP